MNFNEDYKYFPHVVLDIIYIGPRPLIESLKNFAPLISPQIDSFKQNPACECRNKILSYVESNRRIIFEFLNNWFKDEKNSLFTKNLLPAIEPSIIEKKYSYTEVYGKVFEIDDTPEEFLQFKIKMDQEKFIYRSCHIVKDSSKLKIYFL
jgi:hypothetical protein